MKRFLAVASLAVSVAAFPGCKSSSSAPHAGDAAPSPTSVAKMITSADLTEMANAVPSTGPREGNNYKVFMLVLRQNQAPAVNFKVDMAIKGKSQPKTIRTDESGLAKFEDLPYPDAKHPLEGVLHYYKGAEDQPREINYPFIEGDAYRLKDTQYIPNTVTTDAAQ